MNKLKYWSGFFIFIISGYFFIKKADFSVFFLICGMLIGNTYMYHGGTNE